MRLADSWRDIAACKGHPSEWWFPDPRAAGGPALKEIHEQAATAICETCPVKSECLQFALESDGYPAHGIFGGVTAIDRQRMRNQAVR